jgi:porin
MAGAYDGDPKLKQGDRHGVDFSFRGPPFLIAEVGFHSDSSHLKFGGYYNAGTAQVLAGTHGPLPETSRDRYGVYTLGDRTLLHFGDPSRDRHLGIFGAFLAAPDQRVNPVPYFFDGGLVLYGPSRKRPKDLIAAICGALRRRKRRLSQSGISNQRWS